MIIYLVITCSITKLITGDTSVWHLLGYPQESRDLIEDSLDTPGGIAYGVAQKSSSYSEEYLSCWVTPNVEARLAASFRAQITPCVDLHFEVG
jgi:hypothetical protein